MGKYAELFLLFGRIYESIMATIKNKKKQSVADSITADPVDWSNSHFNRVPDADTSKTTNSKRNSGGANT